MLLPLAGTAALSAKALSGIHCRRVTDTAAKACNKEGYIQVDRQPFAFVPWGEATTSGNYIYQGGPDFWPFWEPAFFAILWVVTMGALVLLARDILVGASSPTGLSPDDPSRLSKVP